MDDVTRPTPSEIPAAEDGNAAKDPAIIEALRVFNISQQQYETLLAAQGAVRTSAGEHTVPLNSGWALRVSERAAKGAAGVVGQPLVVKARGLKPKAP